MEYPGTKFTHSIRLTMLIVFLTAFFVISPVIIMYTAGYRYDWQNGLLKETGAISVDVEPQNAMVYLNGIKLQDKMPIRLNNIAPAKYSLRITAPGYFDWLKEIEVKNKQTNYTKEINLIKKNKPEILINAKINNYALSYDGRFIIYSVQKNKGAEIWLWDNSNQQVTILSRVNGLEATTILWAEKNNYALIGDSLLPHSRLLIINAENPLKQTDLAKNNAPIKKFVWANSVDPKLYYNTKENIFLYSPATAKSQVITKNIYLDWYMENGELWTMRAETSTKQYKITKDTLGFSSVFNHLDATDINPATGQTEAENLQMTAARQNTVLLKNNKTSQMILLTGSNKYKIPAEKFIISKYGNWWLMWSEWELWTYSEGEEPYLLNRSGEHLQEVAPMDKYNTLALGWADKTMALFPYYLVNHDFINEKITNLAADTENKILYFINQDKNKQGIWKLNY
ncbi:MAG: PEGA domain-containing protein [Patescibacteria group bacterium]